MGNKTPLDEYFELDEEPCMQSCIKKCKAKHVHTQNHYHILKVLTDLVSQPRKMADNAFDMPRRTTWLGPTKYMGKARPSLFLKMPFPMNNVKGRSLPAKPTCWQRILFCNLRACMLMMWSKHIQTKGWFLAQLGQPFWQLQSEDPDGQFLESDLPSSSRLAILKHGNDDDEKPDGAGATLALSSCWVEVGVN